MMNKFIKLFMFSITLLLFIAEAKAQDAPNLIDAAGRKQGHWIKYDVNKKKIYDGNFVNDMPDGKFVYFLDSGTPWAITVFSQNGKVGRTQRFNKEGKIIAEGKYISQKKDSLWKFFNDEGKLLSIEIYLEDLKNGSCKVYYSNGQLSEDKMWLNGLADGVCTQYFSDGILKFKGQFIKDKAEGKTTFYYLSGKMSVEGFYKNDFKEGEWNYYNEDGTVKKKVLYVNGKSNYKNESDTMTKEELEKAKKQYEQVENKEH